MNMNIKQLYLEPLLHFLLIGAAIFMFYGVSRDLDSEAPGRIVVTSNQQQQLAVNFNRTWMREPSTEELTALIENRVREEVFYREALAMGLDQDDALVRRRMQMKLEFILEDLSSQNITDEALENFLKENRAKFATQAQLSFQQVFLNPNKRKEVEQDAKNILASLNKGVAIETVGDASLLPASYNLSTQSEIARTFGEGFAKEVIELQPGDWIGPFKSAYGVHLLNVGERLDAGQPALADIRNLVEREFLVEKKQQQKDLAYQQLRKNYTVTIESNNDENESDDELIASTVAGKSNEE